MAGWGTGKQESKIGNNTHKECMEAEEHLEASPVDRALPLQGYGRTSGSWGNFWWTMKIANNTEKLPVCLEAAEFVDTARDIVCRAG